MDDWPQVIGYWLTSPSMAAMAARFTSSGAGKSGKPWARLIASCSIASLVISLITDSVSAAAVADARAAGREVPAAAPAALGAGIAAEAAWVAGSAMEGRLAWRGARSHRRLAAGRGSGLAVRRIPGELAVQDVGDPLDERAGQVAADLG